MVRLPRHAPLRRRLRRRPQRRKLGRWLLGAAAVLAAGLFLLPGEQPPQQPLPPAPAIPARAAAIPPAVPAIHRRLPAPESADLPAREALAAAFRERSAALKACLPGVRLTRLPMRLHVGRSGAMKGLDFTGEPPPPALASCVRKTAMGWSFDGVPLSRDVELLVAVSFTAAP